MCKISDELGFCDWGVPHCNKCGEHFSLSDSERHDICDGCLFDALQIQYEAQVESFQGNHEEAAKYFGW